MPPLEVLNLASVVDSAVVNQSRSPDSFAIPDNGHYLFIFDIGDFWNILCVTAECILEKPIVHSSHWVEYAASYIGT